MHDLAPEIFYISQESDPATARGVAYKAMYLLIKRADIFSARLLGGYGGAPKPSERDLTVPGIVRISAEYDNEAKVWVALSDDLPLVTGAETVEQLMAKLPGIIRDLVDDNIRAPASRSN